MTPPASATTRHRPSRRSVAIPGPVLLTGFEPFGGETVNPSEQAVRALEGRTLAGRRVATAILPCVFGLAHTVLLQHLRKHRPSLIVCVGQAGGRAEISLERIAINIDDARIPDNAGARPTDRPVVPGAPTAYWSTLPIKAIVDALQSQGLPAGVSQTAGTFVCNHVFYGLMHALRRRTGARGGFVHLPFLPEQAARLPQRPPSLPFDQIVRALEIVVTTALTAKNDAKRPGGATH